MSINGFILVLEQWQFMAEGLKLTLLVALLSIVFGSVFGLIVVLMRLAPFRIVDWTARVFIDFIRSTPLLVLLLWIFFALPILTGLSFTPLVAGVLTLSLHSAAFLGEIFRAGILSIERGQRHAALSLGMRPSQAFRRVVLPQAVGRMLPPTGNIFIGLIKDSALVSIVGVVELTWQAQVIGGYTLRELEAFTVVAFFYVVLLVIPLSLVVNYVNRRMSPEYVKGRSLLGRLSTLRGKLR
ncbi:MAG: amino acid ABC transporter permease [Chloroflexota bacterium]|nr:amino acid ABC transporter permease [Chloroflexota bacterium]